jgi:hypothetical protein
MVVGQSLAAQNPTPPKTVEEAESSEFKCPPGAHDSGKGPSPGIIVRWCEIEGEGRPLYHGPVWRWYRSGKLEGKEYYVNGVAVGVWPSYYENGKRSSVGALEKGHKRGLWKCWDEAGWLKEEVDYSDRGNVCTFYYPSGRKRASGTFTRSGKIGEWISWAENGTEVARCDFGQGLFVLPDKTCQTIADEFSPKGFSPPIPRATKEADESLSLAVGSEVIRLVAPHGWVPDVKAGQEDQAPLVFYPTGKAWRAPGANMYIRVFFRKGRSFAQTVEDDKQGFQEGVAEYKETLNKSGRLANGWPYRLKSITYKPLIHTGSPFSIVAANQFQERVAYLDASGEFALLLVLSADSLQQLQQSIPAFDAILHSLQHHE